MRRAERINGPYFIHHDPDVLLGPKERSRLRRSAGDRLPSQLVEQRLEHVMIHSVDEDDLPFKWCSAAAAKSSESPTDHDDRISARLVHSRFSITLTGERHHSRRLCWTHHLHEHNGANGAASSERQAPRYDPSAVSGFFITSHPCRKQNASYLPFTSHPTFTHIYCAGKRSQV